KKGDPSKFIEETVRAQVFYRTVQDVKARNADTDTDELQANIDAAVRGVRMENRPRRSEVSHSRMRVILDTISLICALLVQSGAPGSIYRSWVQGAFTLLTCGKQLEE